MSEVPILSYSRELAASEFGWQADLSDELYRDEKLDHSKIDQTLLDGNPPKQTIVAYAELRSCLEARGYEVNEIVLRALRSHINDSLSQIDPSTRTDDKAIDMTTVPVRVVPIGETLNEGFTKKPRREDVLRFGYSPEASAERDAVIAATLEFCEFEESPAGIWLPANEITGVQLARGQSLAGRKIVQAAKVLLEQTGEDRLVQVPDKVKLERVEAYPLDH